MNKLIKLTLSLLMLIMGSTAFAIDFEANGISYSITSPSECAVIAKNGGYSGDIVIPESVEYRDRKLTVVSLGASAFKDCELSSLTLPPTLQEIGATCFQGCSVPEVIIPSPITVTDLDWYVYYDEPGTFYFKKIKTLDLKASELKIVCCTGVTDQIILPNSLEYLSMEGSLTTLDIPESCYTFNIQCENLQKLILSGSGYTRCNISAPEAYVCVPESAQYCDLYSSVKIFETCYSENELRGLKAVGCETFIQKRKRADTPMGYNYFNQPKNLIFGETLMDLSFHNWWPDCLENIVVMNPVPPIPCEFTLEQYADVTLYVPDESIDKYKKADVWKDFFVIRPLSEYQGTLGIKAPDASQLRSKSVIGRYDIHGRSVGEDYRGIVITRYSDGSSSKQYIR